MDFLLDLLNLFPSDPIQSFIVGLSHNEDLETYLAYFNWFVPVSTFAQVLSVWGMCMLAYKIWEIWGESKI